MGDLVERFGRWLQNTGYDGGVNSPPMLIYKLVQEQAAEIRSLRAQVEQERAGIVAWLRAMENSKMDRIDSILSAGGPDYNLGRCTAYAHAAAMIERHEDKEPRS